MGFPRSFPGTMPGESKGNIRCEAPHAAHIVKPLDSMRLHAAKSSSNEVLRQQFWPSMSNMESSTTQNSSGVRFLCLFAESLPEQRFNSDNTSRVKQRRRKKEKHKIILFFCSFINYSQLIHSIKLELNDSKRPNCGFHRKMNLISFSSNQSSNWMSCGFARINFSIVLFFSLYLAPSLSLSLSLAFFNCSNGLKTKHQNNEPSKPAKSCSGRF